MNKTAIKNFAIWARRKLIADITYKAGLIGVTEKGIAAPLPQSKPDLQFFDIGTKHYSEVSGKEVAQRAALVNAIKDRASTSDYKTAFQNIIEEVAYTWFNRLIAVRFMEVNDYLPSRVRVLSSETPKKNEPDFVTTPFDSDLEFTPYERDRVLQLKDENKLDQLFRMLFIKQCNKLNEILPELFEKTDDYTELLLTISFTDTDDVVYHLTHDISEDDFNVSKEGQVEIIGWLYQYYNTEQNELVYDGSMSKSRIPKELLPAATTIYTPDWAIRYMVDNSLGRLWLEGHPSDSTKLDLKYFLEEVEQESSVQAQLEKIRADYKAIQPEDIKIIDPCMGSGHILVYAFDVLMQIYEAQGYTQRDASRLIVEKNIYGIDIDRRAYQIAYFAIMMKARQYDRRFLTLSIEPNLCSIQESNGLSVREYERTKLTLLDRPKLTAEYLIEVFHDAKEYGSILDIKEELYDELSEYLAYLQKEGAGDLLLHGWLNTMSERLPALIKQAKILSQKYYVVVTNPPYLGSSRFSPKLSDYVNANFPDVKSDLSMVVYKHALQSMSKKNGFVAFITTSSWMFLSSFEKLRSLVLSKYDFESIVDYGTELFEGKVGHNPIVSWVNRNSQLNKSFIGIRLVDYCYSRRDEKEPEFFDKRNYHYPKQDNFLRIPGSPIAYWASDKLLSTFTHKKIKDYGDSNNGFTTGDNDLFLRLWFEVSEASISFNTASHEEAIMSGRRWFPYNKGGAYRKWFGNNDYVINWYKSGKEIKDNGHLVGRSMRYQFKESISWSKISSSVASFKIKYEGTMFDVAGLSLFPFSKSSRYYLLALCNSRYAQSCLTFLSPTLNYETGHVSAIPVVYNESVKENVNCLVVSNISISKMDWDSFETSWDFMRHPLAANSNIIAEHEIPAIGNSGGLESKVAVYRSIDLAYEAWEREASERFNTLKSNEEELNRIFIDIYGLQDELTPEVESKEVSVHFIADSKDAAPETIRQSNYLLTKADVIKSFISYAVGCMFGRYSLDVDGLAYAGGDWDASKYKSFIPDADNCIPITDEEYFEDDIVGRLVAFIRTVYGAETLEENLDFIATALGNKGNTSREVIRNYFMNDFFKNHCQIYQKRPIYWLFDSGKQNGFKALVYMHRWNTDTIGNVRVEYLHRTQRVYEKEIARMQDTMDNSRNVREVAAAEKRKEKLVKQLKEARDYDAKIAHLALSRIAIDLDDGVKVNYEKVQTGQDGKKIEILAGI